MAQFERVRHLADQMGILAVIAGSLKAPQESDSLIRG
jgi:hypothetical protein